MPTLGVAKRGVFCLHASEIPAIPTTREKNLPPLRTRAIRSPSDATKVARTLLVVMRCGSLSAAEDITGHKHETIGRIGVCVSLLRIVRLGVVMGVGVLRWR